MLTKFYGFCEGPFGVTPDSRSLYLSHTHREALAALVQGIQASRGFLTLVAEPGMGKTTVLYQLMERLRGSARVAFLFQTQCTSLELVRYLMADLGLDSHGKDLVEMHTELYRVLFEKTFGGSQFVLIVDEAQNLSLEALETIRLISNCETPHTKLLQIVLAGQPQLADKLTHPDLHQLHQRIAIVSELTPLTRDETMGYIRNRLQAAGYRGGPLFAPSALALIAEKCGGIPRKINMLCFNSLSLGYALRRKQINQEIVKEVLLDLDIQRLGQKVRSIKKSVPVRQVRLMGATSPLHSKSNITMRAIQCLVRATALFTILAVGGVFTTGIREEPLLGKISIQSNPNAMSSTELEPHDVVPASAGPIKKSLPANSMVDSASSDGSFDSKAVVVGPKETILQIARKYLGRDDARVLHAIQDLNPQLININQITEGQWIFIPRATENLRVGRKKSMGDTVEKGSHE
jgi:type II secretory pathway predicted ATPase ExeA